MASFTISSFITKQGVPQTGLTPTLRIWEITPTGQSLVIGEANGSGMNTDANMIEVADGASTDGFYRFEFTDAIGFDPAKEYIVRVDGGAVLDAERYQTGHIDPTMSIEVMSNQISKSVADSVWDEPMADHVVAGSMGAALAYTSQTITSISSLLDLLRKYETNRTRIDPNTKTLTIFDDDCTTPLRTFKLLDHDGIPSVEEVCERVPSTTNTTDGKPTCTP